MTVSQVQPDLMPLFSGVPSDPELLQSERAQAGGPSRVLRGAKSLLSGKDFILPELVGHADDGDLSIAVEGSLDSTHLSQIFHLAECGEQPSQNFHDLILSGQQLEKRRYFDFLKRIPQEKAELMTRQEEFEIWLKRNDPEYSSPAEANFLAWYELKQQRRRGSLLRKANRLANCGKSGRPMDCSNHPEEHQFYGEFKCQTRYCRRCGAEIFSALFHKYIGLWPVIEELLPQSGFRSGIVIAKLAFTAV